MCTGNMCRSPAAEALLSAALDQRGVSAHVHSAGTRATLGPAAPEVVELVATHGASLEGFRSRQLTPEMVSDADLVLCMARDHLREAVLAAPDAFERTFTLKEFVRRAATVGVRPPDVPMAAWLAEIHAGREVSELLGNDPLDDVVDPIGQRFDVHREVVAEIAALVGDVSWLVAPDPAPAR
ncbi:MAG: low molecular weight phosphatase family protein [Acidimicrobiia bacterium]|nr:low molecular weight phosphatase family protein [Acidimicrobiia bacterium]